MKGEAKCGTTTLSGYLHALGKHTLTPKMFFDARNVFFFEKKN